ncbi:MAG TPA: NAD(P)/FAD-dependent oxidoreductase [Polyangiaceae bacterium]|nr:NAD(P)/FAD-dependent oxidoreductase [Polyangiaceae bacterium]
MTPHGDRSVQLLVVGAGPVGLLAGLVAARRGLAVEIIDHAFRGFGRGYAALLHPSSVRLLDELGLGAKLRAQGRELHTARVHVDGAEAVALRLPSPAVSLGQSALEELLLDALRAEGGTVHAPLEASTIQQDATGVRVRVVRKELVTLGSPGDYSEWEPIDSALVKADFVIGADGYASKIRTALGVDSVTLGGTQGFAMFEVARVNESDCVELGFADGLGSVALPLPGDKTRLGFQLESGLDVVPDAARLHDLIEAQAPWLKDGMRTVGFSTVVHFERRLARRFGSGRVWLAGDAAHVTSPFGAQSVNLGLSEANDLVARIHACLSRGEGVETLTRYGDARQREWHKLLGVHVRYDLLPHAPPWLGRLARDIGPMLPASGADLASLLQQLGLSVN